MSKTIEVIKSKLSEVSQNILSGVDLYDYVWECSDGDADVIYYYKAKEKVENANSEQLENAESELKDMCFEYEDLNDLYTKLAFFIVKDEYTESFNQEIEDDIESLNSLLDELSEEEEEEEIQELIDTLEAV